MVAIDVEVRGPRERPKSRTCWQEAASSYAAMPGATGINVPRTETLISRVEDRCYRGFVCTVVTGRKAVYPLAPTCFENKGFGKDRERTPVQLRAKRNYDATQ